MPTCQKDPRVEVAVAYPTFSGLLVGFVLRAVLHILQEPLSRAIDSGRVLQSTDLCNDVVRGVLESLFAEIEFHHRIA